MAQHPCLAGGLIHQQAEEATAGIVGRPAIRHLKAVMLQLSACLPPSVLQEARML